MGGWFLSRRDSTIVARHEVPLEFRHFQSVAQSGLKSLAQGLPWVSQNKRSALKGLECALDPLRASGPIFAVPDGPFRANAKAKLTQGNPGLSSLAPSGQGHFVPGYYQLPLRDKSHSPIEAPQNYLSAYAVSTLENLKNERFALTRGERHRMIKMP
jgi:hypothetical protein